MRSICTTPVLENQPDWPSAIPSGWNRDIGRITVSGRSALTNQTDRWQADIHAG